MYDFEAVKDLKTCTEPRQGEESEGEHEGNPESKDIVKYYRYYFVFLFTDYHNNHC